MIFNVNYLSLCRNIFAKRTDSILNSIKITKTDSVRNIKEGPNLKYFLANSNSNNSATFTQSDEVIQNEEIITNRLLTNSHDSVHDERNQLEDYSGKQRKVFVEVHGCQMNTNDTEVALAILNKTGLYKKTNTEKDADVVLISMLRIFF